MWNLQYNAIPSHSFYIWTLCNVFERCPELSPLAIIGDWSIGRGPGWLLGLMGAPLGPILPCIAPCCPGPVAPRGGAEAEPTQPSCCCMAGRGPPGAISPRRKKEETNKQKHTRTHTHIHTGRWETIRNAPGQTSVEVLSPRDAIVWF